MTLTLPIFGVFFFFFLAFTTVYTPGISSQWSRTPIPKKDDDDNDVVRNQPPLKACKCGDGALKFSASSFHYNLHSLWRPTGLSSGPWQPKPHHSKQREAAEEPKIGISCNFISQQLLGISCSLQMRWQVAIWKCLLTYHYLQHGLKKKKKKKN